MDYLKRAHELTEEIVENRRFLHQHPEIGCDIPVTKAFVEDKLKCMGYEVAHVGPGLVAMAGHGSPVILLRADMDGLLMEEESGLPFASVNPGKAHCCGHDNHTAMLLGAAKMLKENEADLKGTVKLMFQPAEETMDGAKMMVEGGVLENPKVDAAFGMHVFTNMEVPAGTVLMMGADSRMAAVDWFTIYVTGKGCHGAQPNSGVDPLNVMAHIHLALQAINAREMDPADNMVLTIGQMHGGNTSNVIPQEGMMSGTIRTLSPETRAMVKSRMEAIVSTIALAFNAQARVEYGSGCPVLTQNKELYAKVKSCLGSLEGVNYIDLDEIGMKMSNMGSEDFAYVANEVPSVFLGIAAGQPADGYCYPQHHPMARFQEDCLPVGAAAYAHIAMEWLKNN